MSVDFEALMVADDVEPREYVVTPVFTGAVWFRAGAARALELLVGYEPIEGDPNQPDNPYHGEVWRNEEARKFKGSQSKGLHSAAEWFVELEDVDIR